MSAAPDREDERPDRAPAEEQPIGHDGDDVPGVPDQTVPVYPSATMPQPIPAGADQLDEPEDAGR